MDDAELEGADGGGAVDRIFFLLHRQLAAGQHVLHDLPQIDVHALRALEAEVQPDAEDAVGAVGLQVVGHGLGFVQDVDVDKPVGLRPLGVLVQNGVEDIPVDVLRVRLAVQIDEVVGQQGDLAVIVQRHQTVHMVPHMQAGGVFLFQLGAAVPDDLEAEEDQREEHGHIAAVHELAQARDEEDGLDAAEDDQHQEGRDGLLFQVLQEDEQQQRGHQHRDRDGETVGRLHAGAGAEIEHHQAAADPQHAVDRADIELPLDVRGIADFQMRQQVQQDGLRDKRVRAGDQGLGGDDRRCCAQQHGEGTQGGCQHQEEGVQVHHVPQRRVAPALDDPGTLAEIVQNQAQLDEGPAEIDVLLADVAHVRIQRLGAGGRKEDTAQDHEAELVCRAQQDPHGVNGVKGLQHHGQGKDMRGPRDAEEGEPEQHDRAEGLADAAGAGVLDREKRRDDDQGDDNDLDLARAEKAVHHFHASKAFHGGGDGDGRGQDAVGQQGRTPQHRGDDEPLAAAAHQREQREDAALAVVVRLHGDQHVFDGGQQGDGPDDEGERADDKGLVDLGDPAVALEDRLHDVHGRGADVAVDDPNGHEEHAESEFRLVFHIVYTATFISLWYTFCNYTRRWGKRKAFFCSA